MYIGDSPETRLLRRRVADFLAVESEQSSDRKVYLTLILVGLALLYAFGGSGWNFAIAPFYVLAEVTYGRRAVRLTALPEVDPHHYRNLRVHHFATVLGYSSLILVNAFHPGFVSAWAAGLLIFGQVLNCIGHETRSVDATRFGVVIVSAVALVASLGITRGLRFDNWDTAFVLLSVGIVAIYFVKVASNTARTRANLTDRTDALRHAQKGEAVGRLTSGIAHDFNNLLTVMRGNIDLLNEVPEAERGPLLREIGDATDRGGRLVGQLLASARRGDRREEVIQVGDFLDTFTAFARRVLPANVELHVRADRKLTLRCDTAQLDSALLNLIVNARDAMPGGGDISIQAEDISAPHDSGRAGAERGSWIMLSVVDDGPGMSPDVLARATEPFMTTKPAGQGSGLGLAMVRDFADRAGGSFVLDSRPGQGTAARLKLPN